MLHALKTTPGIHLVNKSKLHTEDCGEILFQKTCTEWQVHFGEFLFQWSLSVDGVKGSVPPWASSRATQVSRTMPNDPTHTRPFATIKITQYTLSVSISQWDTAFLHTEHNQALTSGEIKKKKRRLKEKGAQLSGLKKQYFILHIWSYVRSRNTHLCQNYLLNFSGDDLADEIDTQRTKGYRDGGISCQQKILSWFMSSPYSLMKSALLWVGFHCCEKWILQLHPVLWVHFSTVALCWAQNREGMKVRFTMQWQEQRNVWKERTSFTNCHCDFPEVFAFFWNCGSTARRLSSAECIWARLHCMNSRNAH